MGANEVTVGQYKAFVAVSGYKPRSVRKNGIDLKDFWKGMKPQSPTNKHPVINLTWGDVVAYAKWGGETSADRSRVGICSPWRIRRQTLSLGGRSGSC